VPTALIGCDLAAARDFCRRENYRAAVEFATWDDLRQLAPQLFTIGSHPRNDPRLSEISSVAGQ
jgi:hypothetical protein